MTFDQARDQRSDRYRGDDEYNRGGAGSGSYGGYGEGRRTREGTWDFYAISWWVPGEHSGRGPKNYTRSDERIKEDVSERLEQSGQIDADDIEVEAENGIVTLRGTVPNRQMKRMAEDAAESCSGVKDIRNELRLEDHEHGPDGRRADGKETARGDRSRKSSEREMAGSGSR